MNRLLAVLFASCSLVSTVTCAADLRIGINGEPTLDPHYMWTDANVAYYMQIYGGLTQPDRQGAVLPYLASAWKPIGDGRVWEFTLRHDVKFQDGSPVTADDVVASYTRMKTIKAAASFAGAIPGFIEAKKVDDYTVDIVTAKPVPTVPQRAELIQILPAKIAETAATADFANGKVDIGFGPYRVVSFKSGDSLVLARNPLFFGPKPRWDKVTYRFISDDGARVAALLGKDVDLINAVPPALLGRLKSDPSVNVVTGPSSRMMFLAVDDGRAQTPFITGPDNQPLAKNPLQDLRVRQALSLAIDRKLLIQRVLGGLGYPTGQLTPKGFGGYNPDIAVTEANTARAKALLAQAGYPAAFGLTIDCTNDHFVADARVCQAMGEMISRIGIKVNVQTMPAAVFMPQLMDKNGKRFTVAMLGWSDSSGEAMILYNILHTYAPEKGFGAWNTGRYSNPELDAVIEQASATMDASARHALMSKAMKIGMDDLGVIPLYEQGVAVAVRKGLDYQTWLTEYILADSVIPAAH